MDYRSYIIRWNGVSILIFRLLENQSSNLLPAKRWTEEGRGKLGRVWKWERRIEKHRWNIVSLSSANQAVAKRKSKRGEKSREMERKDRWVAINRTLGSLALSRRAFKGSVGILFYRQKYRWFLVRSVSHPLDEDHRTQGCVSFIDPLPLPPYWPLHLSRSLSLSLLTLESPQLRMFRVLNSFLWEWTPGGSRRVETFHTYCTGLPVSSQGRGGGSSYSRKYICSRARGSREGRRTRRGRIETALEWNISLSFLSCRLNLKSDRGLNTITDPFAARSEGKPRLGSSVKLERLVLDD